MTDTGVKHDDGKLDLGAVDWDRTKAVMDLLGVSAWNKVMDSLASVLEHGADRYGGHTWDRVSVERYRSALLRHATSTGEDEDSGLDHLEHVLCNACFLVALS